MSTRAEDIVATSAITEGLSGRRSVTFTGKTRGRNEIVVLTEKMMKDPSDFPKLNRSRSVSFQVTPNRKNVVPGSVELLPTPEESTGSGSSVGGSAFGATTRDCAMEQEWVCPFIACGKVNPMWFPKSPTDCLKCKRRRPVAGEDTGRWLRDSATGRWCLAPTTWVCPACELKNPLFLGLPACAGCERPKEAENGRTTFWRRTGSCYKLLRVEIPPLVLDGSTHTTLDEIVTRGMERHGTAESPRCGLCEKDAHGRGVRSFLDYYGLTDERGVLNLYRRRWLQAVLLINGKCQCGLRALPAPGHNQYFRETTVEDPRNAFDTRRDRVMEEIGELELQTGTITRYLQVTTADTNMLCHLVPLTAGGCITSLVNVVPVLSMCPLCQWLDAVFTVWTGEGIPELGRYAEEHPVEGFDAAFSAWVARTAHESCRARYLELCDLNVKGK